MFDHKFIFNLSFMKDALFFHFPDKIFEEMIRQGPSQFTKVKKCSNDLKNEQTNSFQKVSVLKPLMLGDNKRLYVLKETCGFCLNTYDLLLTPGIKGLKRLRKRLEAQKKFLFQVK